MDIEMKQEFEQARLIFKDTGQEINARRAALSAMTEVFPRLVASAGIDHAAVDALVIDAMSEFLDMRIPLSGGGLDPSMDDHEWSVLHMIWWNTLLAEAQTRRAKIEDTLISRLVSGLADRVQGKQKQSIDGEPSNYHRILELIREG